MELSCVKYNYTYAFAIAEDGSKPEWFPILQYNNLVTNKYAFNYVQVFS